MLGLSESRNLILNLTATLSAPLYRLQVSQRTYGLAGSESCLIITDLTPYPSRPSLLSLPGYGLVLQMSCPLIRGSGWMG